MIQFQADKHLYTKNNENYLSVTSLLKKLDPTDWDLVKQKYATKHGLTIEEVTQKWATQADGGTKIHAHFENATINGGGNVIVHKESDGIKYGHDLSTLTEGIYPELILYSDRYKIAGQSDLVEIYEDKVFKIRDIKTDRVLSFESFKEFDPVIKRRVPKYFKEPISGLELCNYNKYCLQLSVYALMLEQFRFKLSQEEDALQITHFTTERDEKGDHVLDANGLPIILKEDKYNLPYLKEEAKAVLNYYLNLNTL
jgi:hypothetical protein